MARTVTRPLAATERLLQRYRDEDQNPFLYDETPPSIAPRTSPLDGPEVPSMVPNPGPARQRKRSPQSRAALAAALEGGSRG